MKYRIFICIFFLRSNQHLLFLQNILCVGLDKYFYCIERLSLILLKNFGRVNPAQIFFSFYSMFLIVISIDTA